MLNNNQLCLEVTFPLFSIMLNKTFASTSDQWSFLVSVFGGRVKTAAGYLGYEITSIVHTCWVLLSWRYLKIILVYYFSIFICCKIKSTCDSQCTILLGKTFLKIQTYILVKTELLRTLNAIIGQLWQPDTIT